ncbi:MAG TPA: hypothetical protein VGL35_09970 [Rhizomicrobium sp.]|jgi:hypothetical protein
MDVPIKFVGLSAEASALVERLRERPEQPETEIIANALRKLVVAPAPRPTRQAVPRAAGCDLGQGAILRQDEKIYCYLRKGSVGRSKPDGVAIARDGALFIDEQRVEPQRGAWLQAALKIVQNRVGDISETTGEAKSLNAWIQWFVRRNDKLIPVGELRVNIHRRGLTTELTVEELGL